MTNRSKPEVEVFAGIDVSAREISVARLRGKEENPKLATFVNRAGHKALLAFLLQGTDRVRVCLESSGNYSLDLALALHAHGQVEISVINPGRARRFAESLGERSKTDPVDARILCQYAARMPWVAWQPPSSLALRLRAITRAIASLVVMHTQESNRAHALGSSQALPALVLRERQRHQRYLEHRMKQLRREALRLIARDRELDRRFRLMLTVPGIAETSALQILGGWPCSPIRWMSPVGGLQRTGSFSIHFRYFGGEASPNQSQWQSSSAPRPVYASAGGAAP